jgi:hypothetical protein
MFLHLILIHKIILCSDGKYLHFSCANLNVTGMITLGLRVLFAVKHKVCILGALMLLQFGRTAGLSEQPDCRDSRINRTAGLSGHPDYRDSQINGRAGLLGQPDYRDSWIIGTAGLSGQPDYQDSRIIGTAGLSGQPD